MEGVGQSKQPLTLEFINVIKTPTRAHLSVQTAEEARRIRAHVMKDYLQQRKRSSESRIKSPAASNLSDHLTRFRLSSAQDRKQPRSGAKEITPSEHSSTSESALKEMRALMPRDHQSLHEVVLARSLANNVSYKIPSPIDVSTPGTLALLEYYHTSFWDNSIAVNPEGKWMSVAISDSALLHALLCLVALHKFQTLGEPHSDSYFWHRGEAMRLVSKNLADPDFATSDANITAVSILSSSDNSVSIPIFLRSPLASQDSRGL